jgi:hypothetical protein
VRDEWIALLASREDENPFVDPDFCEVWARHNSGGRPFVVTARQGGELTALAPLKVTAPEGMLPLKRIRFIVDRPWFEIDFVPKGVSEVTISKIMETVKRHSPANVIEFYALPWGSSTIKNLYSAVQGKGMKIEYSYSPEWCNAFVETECGWESYFDDRSSKLKKNLRRAQASLEDEGDLAFRRISHFDQAAAAKMIEVVRGSWKKDHIFDQGGFWWDLVELMESKGWLDIHMMELDGMPISFALILRSGPNAYLLQTFYQDRYSQYSPGNVVIWNGIEELFGDSDPPETIDFLTSYHYLKRLSTGIGTRLKARIYSGHMSGPLKRLFRLKNRLRPVVDESFFDTLADIPHLPSQAL